MEAPKKTLLQKALTKGEPKDLDRDEVLDIVYWFRCLVGLTIGLLAGIMGITGYPVILIFGVSLFGLTHFYLTSYLEVDQDDFN